MPAAWRCTTAHVVRWSGNAASSHVDAWQSLIDCTIMQSQQYSSTPATSAAKAFGDFVKQESARLQQLAPIASRYQRQDEFDEEDEIEVEIDTSPGLPLQFTLLNVGHRALILWSMLRPYMHVCVSASRCMKHSRQLSRGDEIDGKHESAWATAVGREDTGSLIRRQKRNAR